MIYFAQLPTGSIKIGCTKDVESRMQSLGSHYGVEPALLATMEGDRSTEAEIHARFASARLGRTEQFRPVAELMEFVGEPLLVGINPDAVEAMGTTRLAGTKAVRLELPIDVHRELRIEAAKRDTHMSALARIAVEEFLAKRKSGGK